MIFSLLKVTCTHQPIFLSRVCLPTVCSVHCTQYGYCLNLLVRLLFLCHLHFQFFFSNRAFHHVTMTELIYCSSKYTNIYSTNIVDEEYNVP